MIELNRKEYAMFQAGGLGLFRRYADGRPAVAAGTADVLVTRVVGDGATPVPVAEVTVLSVRPVRLDGLEALLETLRMDGWRGVPEVKGHLARRYPGLRGGDVVHYVRVRVDRMHIEGRGA